MERVSTSVLSSDETARKILVIVVSDFGIQSGGLLPIGCISAGWHQRHRHHEDFDAGLQYAIGHGWIEILPSGYKLTARGYAVAGRDATDGCWRGVTPSAAAVAGVPPAGRC